MWKKKKKKKQPLKYTSILLQRMEESKVFDLVSMVLCIIGVVVLDVSVHDMFLIHIFIYLLLTTDRISILT